ncbi:DUF1906 domain-containing protein [Kitasatospora sp. NPDC094015]|uniref:DUF1906 domain-containing protein n=1 Tax=Kitasatospora sp. NPDC094015 TaxID=3155205 RepID=UPI00331A41EF
MRYLGPAALTAASLVLLLATDGTVLDGGRGLGGTLHAGLAAAPAPTPPQPPPRRRVLSDPRAKREALPSEVFTGAGFDACTAPPPETMRAWRAASPYGAIGIYSSGDQRACDQPRLTAAWVREVRAMGWQLIPTHVGLQAPCRASAGKPKRIDPDRAVQQGRDEAALAVRGLRSLQLATGSPVYLDIESYPRGDAACSQAVIDFTLGWTQALHAAGFHSGFYSSTDSGIADLAAAARVGSSPLPDAVWYARWDDRADTVDGSGPLGADLWAGHQRIHQHHGNVAETYGGVTLTVDRDQLDTLVALVAP